MQGTPQTAAPAKPPTGGMTADRNVHPIPPEFDAGPILALDHPKLIQLLKDPGATAFQKAKACQRLAAIGTKEAVPALASLLGDQHLGMYARFGLEPIPDPSADDALRAALGKLKGRLLVGVINSVGVRKDAKAVDALGKLLYGADSEAAQCAAAALGRIGGPSAAKVLQDGLAGTRLRIRDAVAGAGLVCAEGLLAQGDRKQALALYQVLSRTDMPKAVRLGAMHSIVAAETSVSRPRSSGTAPSSPPPKT